VTAGPDHDDRPGAVSGLSFDPNTWLKPGAKAVEEPRSPPDSAPPPARPAPSSRRGLLIGAGAAAGVAVVGAAAFAILRPGRKAGSPPGQRQVLTLSDFGSLGPALAAAGLGAQDSAQIIAAAKAALPPAASGELRLEMDLARDAGAVSLLTLTVTRPDGLGVKVTRGEQGFVAAPLTATTASLVKVARGQMDAQSFYSSAVSSGLSDVLIPQFFQAFVYDFDFQREIARGDLFEAAYEQQVNSRQEAVGAQKLLYASMTTKQKSRALYRFVEAGQAPEWFDGSGKNIRRSLMRTPVEGARISSTFGMRDHPVLGFTRMHKGTDFATPAGTPVFASGAGLITAMGLHGEYGNYVAIKHNPMLSTAYAHLSAFAPDLHIGSQVNQGQQIALSGNTGLSSGPHVHYEVLVDGQQVDSQAYQTEEGRALAGPAVAAFTKERDRIDAARAASL
jgi:murein DD-endopeptidase MepM/ murein hydrolase activator NlpD